MADALSWLQQLLGGGQAAQPNGDALGQLQQRLVERPYDYDQAPYQSSRVQQNPQTGATEPSMGEPSAQDAGNMLYGMTGIPDMQQAYDAWQRGEYPQAVGQGAYGAANAATLAVPALRGLSIGARAAAPVVREAAGALPEMLVDETGALRLYRGAPPDVTSPQSLGAMRNRLETMAREGEQGRPWYANSGRAIGEVTGGDLERADKLAQNLAIASPQTPVPLNTEFSVRGHNQAMVGDPIATGLFKGTVSSRLNDVYNLGLDWEGRKTNEFYDTLMKVLDPGRPHGVVADIQIGRAFGYPGPGGKGVFAGSPTTAQYDFQEREVENLINRLNQNADHPWTKEEVQAAIWTAQKMRHEGLSPDAAAFDFSHGLDRSMAQQSWESIPGANTGHLPEMFKANPQLKQDFHREVVDALTDPQGRDLISQHFGLLTGKTFDAPGAFEGAVNPGSQARSAVANAPGSGSLLIDPSSKELIDMAEWTRGLINAQKGSAWHRPFYREADPLKNRNLSELLLDRPLTDDEASQLYDSISRKTGSDFFPPIGSPRGARFLNVPDYSKVDNRAFQRYVQEATQDVFGREGMPNVEIVHRSGDSNYLPI